MRVVPYQEIMQEKLARQEKLLKMGAKRDADGHCFHVGEISPGCRMCFTQEPGSGIQIGTQCMCKCPYCYYDPNRLEESADSIKNKISDFFYQSLRPEQYKATTFSYQSSGETLYYINELEKIALILDNMEKQTGIHQYRFLYTNGILANKEMLIRLKENLGVHEIRFHLSASNFSKLVLKNMELAKEMGFFVTVEEPSWPHHREEIMELLPFFEKIGLKHLDMVEVQISDYNRDAIEKCYPEDKWRAYKDHFYHMYDEGLVYDIMEEVINKGYHFSVIDCSSAVERCRQCKTNQPFRPKIKSDTLKGMCAPWDYGYEELNSATEEQMKKFKDSLIKK
ncbi:MAG: hypothetical protein PHT94_01435 [Candidatus Nanoarchaeia archaeon]|nr:hypothetical protein [Candidatus Nanoarchaeia archaeon]